MSEKKKYVLFIVIVMIIGLVVYSQMDRISTNIGYASSDLKSNKISIDDETTAARRTIYVQLSGEVNAVGVYELQEGSRVYEAVELAGGTTTSAALYMVNQAKLLEDGEHIHFPKISEAEELAASLININTASAKTLTELSGIGDAKANNIVSYRETNG
ncbi:MAG: helix-hairpin-helix domain-containing protein, partial [Vallitaleaceae bacterium]|nr:helix-hairpin-helix domain-containing protein [Vallitaleaceae bacterium]